MWRFYSWFKGKYNCAWTEQNTESCNYYFCKRLQFFPSRGKISWKFSELDSMLTLNKPKERVSKVTLYAATELQYCHLCICYKDAQTHQCELLKCSSFLLTVLTDRWIGEAAGVTHAYIYTALSDLIFQAERDTLRKEKKHLIKKKTQQLFKIQDFEIFFKELICLHYKSLLLVASTYQKPEFVLRSFVISVIAEVNLPNLHPPNTSISTAILLSAFLMTEGG